jgi:hypothetical protein
VSVVLWFSGLGAVLLSVVLAGAFSSSCCYAFNSLISIVNSTLPPLSGKACFGLLFLFRV